MGVLRVKDVDIGMLRVPDISKMPEGFSACFKGMVNQSQCVRTVCTAAHCSSVEIPKSAARAVDPVVSLPGGGKYPSQARQDISARSHSKLASKFWMSQCHIFQHVVGGLPFAGSSWLIA